MKAPTAAIVLALALVPASSDQTNPISKVLQMLSSMQGELIADGEKSQKMYAEFSNWCESRSHELHFEIKTGKAQAAALKAGIEKATADGEVLETKISDNAGDLSDDESELKEAGAIRQTERKTFVELEKELAATADTIERALSIIQKEMRGSGFLQMQGQQDAQDVVQALQAMVEASSVSSADAARLTALVQSQSSSEEDDETGDMGAPDPAAYSKHGGPIVETLQGLLEKTESQMAKARKQEEQAAQEYAMKKQSLENSKAIAGNELGEAKRSLAATQEKKAVSEGDLAATTKDLHEDLKELEGLHHTCLGKATAFEEETKARGDEIKALTQAKKILQETTGDATSQTSDLLDTSFVQIASRGNVPSGASALRIIRRLAYSQRSAAFAQLASRIQSTMRLSTVDGSSPFEKVAGMLEEMLGNLEKEAGEEASEKEYCDKERSETAAKLDDKKDDTKKLSTKIAQMEGASGKLKSEIAILQKELAALAKTQAELDQIRLREKAAYEKDRPEMEQGLNGVKQALKVLKDYYAKPAFLETQTSTSLKGPSAILGLLETCESDFSKLLAEMIADEEQSQATHTETTKENAMAKSKKEADVSYKQKEAASLDKSIAELKSDFDGASEEESAIVDYEKELKGKCSTMPASYDERKKKREAELAGLKEALTTLESTSFVQLGASRRSLHAVHPHT